MTTDQSDAKCGDINPDGGELCGRHPGHLGFHRYVLPGGERWVSWVGNVPGIDAEVPPVTTDPTPAPEVRAGQTYLSCDPRDSIRLRVHWVSPGATRAQVVDAATGKRPRMIYVKSLHASATGPSGKRRRTGYALDTAANREVLRG